MDLKMKPVWLIARTGPLMATVLLIAACQSARMALPGFLEQHSEAYACVGRHGLRIGEDFHFGPYQVHNVKRGWRQRVAWDVAFSEGSAHRQEFEYMVWSHGDTLWHGNAVTGVRRKDVRGTIGGGEWRWDLVSDVNYLARFADDKHQQFWTLAMAEGHGDFVMSGELSDGTAVYRVEGTQRLAGSSMPLGHPAGFIFYRQHRPIAAVETINKGVVYLDRELSRTEKDVLAVAATALLLYRDIAGR